MSETINPIKELVNEGFKNNIYGNDREDLNYVDLFFPKLLTLLGTEGCLLIQKGEDVAKVFEKVGLEKEDYESISSLVQKGNSISKENDSLEILLDLDKKSDVILNGYLNKVRYNMILTGKSAGEIEAFDKSTKEFFGNNPNIFTPCSVYENELGQKKM